MDKNKLQLLAQKYLDGTATSKEKQLLDQWYDTIHTGWPEVVDLNESETEADIKQRMFNNLNRQLFPKPDIAHDKNISGEIIKRITLWIGSAAAILALTFFAWSWYNHGKADMSSAMNNELVHVPLNRVMRLTLSDGSKVWLNSGSVFRYPKQFSGKTRTVELVEGRAFFDVRHQTEHPFFVKTKSLNITVLGTSFDVRSYQKEKTTRVSVVTGKVGITRPTQAGSQVIMLLPKQEVVLNDLTHRLTKENTRETAVNAWCKNNFIFEQESLGNIFKALEKEYNTRINVDNKKLLEERISITLNNQHLDTIMEILSFTKHFKYQMTNDSTVIVK